MKERRMWTKADQLHYYFIASTPLIIIALLVRLIVLTYQVKSITENVQYSTDACITKEQEPNTKQSNCPQFCKNNNGAICRNMGCY